MNEVDVNEAGAILRRLVAAAESGETVMLTRGGQPVVELVRLRPRKVGVKLGLLKGRVPEWLLEEVARPAEKPRS